MGTSHFFGILEKESISWEENGELVSWRVRFSVRALIL